MGYVCGMLAFVHGQHELQTSGENLREQVVHDVSSNDAMEQVAVDPTHISVDGGTSALDECPAIGVKVLHILMVVVKVGDGNEPVVDPEVGNSIEQEGGQAANSLASQVESVSDQSQTDIGDQDVQGLLGAEDDGCGLEVGLAEPAALALQTLRTSRDVEQQVCLPSEQLVADKLDQVHSRGLLKQLAIDAQVRPPGACGDLALVVLLGRGDESHILLHVAGVHVVASVAEFPAEEGDEQKRVEDPTDNVVQVAVKREGTVSTLVCQDPDTGPHETLGEPVGCPSTSAGIWVGELWDVCECGIYQAGGECKIARNIAQRSEGRRLEAVRGNRFPQGVHVWVDGLEGLLLWLSVEGFSKG